MGGRLSCVSSRTTDQKDSVESETHEVESSHGLQTPAGTSQIKSEANVVSRGNKPENKPSFESTSGLQTSAETSQSICKGDVVSGTNEPVNKTSLPSTSGLQTPAGTSQLKDKGEADVVSGANDPENKPSLESTSGLQTSAGTSQSIEKGVSGANVSVNEPWLPSTSGLQTLAGTSQLKDEGEGDAVSRDNELENKPSLESTSGLQTSTGISQLKCKGDVVSGTNEPVNKTSLPSTSGLQTPAGTSQLTDEGEAVVVSRANKLENKSSSESTSGLQTSAGTSHSEEKAVSTANEPVNESSLQSTSGNITGMSFSGCLRTQDSLTAVSSPVLEDEGSASPPVQLAPAETSVISGDGNRVDISKTTITLSPGNKDGGDVNLVKGDGARLEIKQSTIIINKPQADPSDLQDIFLEICEKQIESIWKGHEKITEDYKTLHEPDNESSSNFEINRELFQGNLGARSKRLQGGKSTEFRHTAKSDVESLKYETLKKTVLNSKEKKLAITGTAGAGKTLFTKRLIRDLSKSDKRPPLIVFNNFRDFPDGEEITPQQLLFGGLCEDESVLLAGYKWLLENQDKAILIFDGLDQAPWSINPKAKLIRPHGKGKASDIMSNIFSGRLLPNVKVVYTSREHSVVSLEGKCRPDMVIMMTGLCDTDVESLFISLVGDDGDELWNKLTTKSHSLVPLLSTPVFLIFAAIVYKSNTEKPPQFVTGLMLEILELFKGSGHITEKNFSKVMKGLERMSFKGLKQKMVMFMLKHLRSAGLDPEEIRDWMIKFPGKNRLNQFLLEGQIIVFFSHQSIQEVLGACYVSKLELKKFKKIVQKYLSDDFWSLTLRFISGIILNKEIELEGTTISNKEEKQKILKKFLASKYKNANNDTEKLSVLAAISESNDKEFIQSVIDSIKISGYPISAAGMHVIGSILRHCQLLEKLRLQDCSLDDTTANILWQSVSGKDCNVQISALNISGNTIDLEMASTVGKFTKQSSIDKLNMYDCSLTDEGLNNFLAEAKGSKLSFLNVSINDLSKAAINRIRQSISVEEIDDRNQMK